MSAPTRLGLPNWITIARLLLIAPFVICLLNLNDPGRAWLRWVAIGVFALMALSDFLDGFLARRLHSESPLGRFLDPLADKLLITAAVIILAVVGVPTTSDMQTAQPLRLPSWVAVVAVGKDLIVSIGFALVCLTTGRVFIRPRAIGKACTAIQLALVLLMLFYMDLPEGLTWVLPWLWWTASVLAALAVIDYILLGNRFVASTTERDHT